MYKIKGLGREPVNFDDEKFQPVQIDDPVVSTSPPPVVTSPTIRQLITHTQPVDFERKNITEALLLVEELNEKQLEYLIVKRDDLSPKVRAVLDTGLKKKRGLVPVTTPLVDPSFVPDSSVAKMDAVQQAGLIPEIGDTTALIASIAIATAFIFFSDSKPQKQQIGF